MLEIKLLVPPAQRAVDFIDLFCVVNYPGRAVKGSFQQQVTSHLHQLILIICPSHDSGQPLAFSCVFEGALSEKETDGSVWARGTGGRPSCLSSNHINCSPLAVTSCLKAKNSLIWSFFFKYDFDMIHNFAGGGRLMDDWWTYRSEDVMMSDFCCVQTKPNGLMV